MWSALVHSRQILTLLLRVRGTKHCKCMMLLLEIIGTLLYCYAYDQSLVLTSLTLCRFQTVHAHLRFVRTFIYYQNSFVSRATGPVGLLHHDGCVSSCDFSNDSEFKQECVHSQFNFNMLSGTLLVSCGYDMQVSVWNMNNHQLINSYKV